jgi:hypothetical protein
MGEDMQSDISVKTQKLSKLLKRISRENTKKFELYSSRNIFVSSDDSCHDISEVDHSESRKSSEFLRNRYLALVAENKRLSDECLQKDQLLTDMTSALFNIRVGKQALDLYDVNPLGDTVEGIREHCAQLEELSRRANGVCPYFLLYNFRDCIR